MRHGSLMCTAVTAISLSAPSLARDSSEFVFFQQSIDNWRIEASTEVVKEKEPLVKEVRCQAISPGLAITLFRSSPPILSFSYRYQDAKSEALEVPESELDWVEIDGRRLTARYRLRAYLGYRFNNVTYSDSSDEGSITFGGGNLDLQEVDGPWLPSSAYLGALVNSRRIDMSYHGPDPKVVRLSTTDLRRALRICSEKIDSSAALTLPPEWRR